MICSAYNQYILRLFKAVHFRKQLIDSSSIWGVFKHSSRLIDKWVDLVNEDDTGGVFSCFSKQLSHSLLTNSYKDLIEVRTTRVDEIHPTLASYRSR